MNDVYLSIKSPAQAEFKEKGSKFFAFCYPVKDESEIKQSISQLKEKYWDASHHCYAYMLGPRYDVFRANDAGEPNHSAGDPILSQIKSFNLTDILVVVVRYFGGTKLGVSGLIAAYKTAAREAISQAIVIEKYITTRYTVTFVSEQTSLVMKTIKNSEALVHSQTFDYETLNSVIHVEIRSSRETSFKENLQGALGIEISCNL